VCFSFYITCVYILLLYSSYIFFSMPPAKKAKFPCGVCKKECNAKSVGCGECDTWYHYSCEKLDQHHIKEVESLPLEYVCTNCTTRWGYFQYQNSLQRLNLAASKSVSALKTAARMERVLLRNHTLYDFDSVSSAAHVQDIISNELIALSGGIADKHPYMTSTDGNCLFNSASMATYKNVWGPIQSFTFTCTYMPRTD